MLVTRPMSATEHARQAFLVGLVVFIGVFFFYVGHFLSAPQTSLFSATVLPHAPPAAAIVGMFITTRPPMELYGKGKGSGKRRSDQMMGKQKAQTPPIPPVDPDNEEFVMFVRPKRMPQWVPYTIVMGGSQVCLVPDAHAFYQCAVPAPSGVLPVRLFPFCPPFLLPARPTACPPFLPPPLTPALPRPADKPPYGGGEYNTATSILVGVQGEAEDP